jgi:cyanophycinase
MMTRILALSVAFTLAACAGGETGAPAADEGPQAGRLVIIGGGLQAENTPVYQAILDGRDGEGPVCVFPTASAEPEGSMASAVQRIDAVGGEGTAEGIFLTVDNPEDATLPEIVTRIESCSGFYFSGGSQSRIVRVFRPEGVPSPAFEALLERHAEGAVVSGSSAGAAIMTDPMIGGGSSLGALNSGVRGDGEEEGVILEHGLGIWDGAFVDQHFLARGRWARLLVAVLATDGFDFGLGIDENTAIVVDGTSARVVGASGAILFDTRDAHPNADGYGAEGVVMYLLGAGDAVDVTDGTVQRASDKNPLPQARLQETPTFGPEANLFERWALLQTLAGVAESGETSFSFQHDGHLFVLRKGPGFSALSGTGEGVEGAPAGLSMGPLILDVTPLGE